MRHVHTEASSVTHATSRQSPATTGLISNKQLAAKEESLGLVSIATYVPNLAAGKAYSEARRTLVNFYVAALFGGGGRGVALALRQRLVELNERHAPPYGIVPNAVKVEESSPMTFQTARGAEERAFVKVTVNRQEKVYEFSAPQNARAFATAVCKTSTLSALDAPGIAALSLRYNPLVK